MWQSYTYQGPTESLPYFVYTPKGYRVGKAVPLVLMLHGCTQTATDFAAGTRMNEVADEQQFIVIYPEQTRNRQSYRCWNWYDPAHHYRGSGEPALLASIVYAVLKDTAQWTIDQRRIFVAGLSAGATMATILGATYPDLFAALGLHSGLEYQAATSQLAGMRASLRGGPNPALQGKAAFQAMGSFARSVPVIVFQGTRDTVVDPINSDQVIQQWIQTDLLASEQPYTINFHSPATTTKGQVPGGRHYTIYSWNDANGRELHQYWRIEGMGHAWSGGHNNGSNSDPSGPDASRAMYRFFLDHPMPGSADGTQPSAAAVLWKKLRNLSHHLWDGI
jgi:poly(hydroxyalkanoate) depolymerase family esterase